jgi:dTDP-4-dehydrorhamnose reductase
VKILILGGRGMLGHKLFQRFQKDFDCWATFRQPTKHIKKHPLYACSENIMGGVDIDDFATVETVIEKIQPNVIINCIGIINQLKEAKDPLISIGVNSILPHKLANLCRQTDKRLITISTDCVFSGLKGVYKESDNPDPVDLYGRSKLLGEVNDGHNLTLRTSIIGRELYKTLGLIEWFYSQRGKQVNGFHLALYSGLTTIALSDVIQKIILEHPNLKGLYHVSSAPINKFDLLSEVRDFAKLNIHINPDDRLKIDRSLNSECFSQVTSILIPTWCQMIEDMVSDPTPYDTWRELDEII